MPAATDLASTASELRIVLGQLVRRLRADNALPTSHLAVLSRLDRLGPQTASGLAAAEHMRPQSMAQTVAELQKEGLVERRPDSVDRRQILVELTQGGRDVLDDGRRRREDWLSKAIAELTPAEQQVLLNAVDLLRRLAEL
jgi:DNA-binding MarR family transcriptional regulator